MVSMPVEVKKDVYWVGALDWEERDFHSFEISRGTTYNAYLIIDEKITLVDTVKDRFFTELIERVKRLVDASKIDYIISNHVEIDHSGSLANIKEIARNSTIVCTEKGKDGICKHFNCENWKFKIVRTGDELKISKKTLAFIETPMLHWPDSMTTYVKEDKLLLSNDAFGQHVVSVERYDEEFGVEDAIRWAKIYYANILMPFGELVKKKLDEIKNLGIQIDMIAPSHGIIWKNPGQIIDAYRKWANFDAENKLVIVYDTMWNSTATIAKIIAEGAKSKGVNVRLFHTRKDSWANIMTEILDARAIAVGAPTMHNTIFPPMAGFLAYMKGLRPKNKIGVAFGSYGWGAGAVNEINRILENLKLDCIEPLQTKFRPTENELEKAFEAGVKIAEKIKYIK